MINVLTAASRRRELSHPHGPQLRRIAYLTASVPMQMTCLSEESAVKYGIVLPDPLPSEANTAPNLPPPISRPKRYGTLVNRGDILRGQRPVGDAAQVLAPR
jgi:hypothetical protein